MILRFFKVSMPVVLDSPLCSQRMCAQVLSSGKPALTLRHKDNHVSQSVETVPLREIKRRPETAVEFGFYT